MRSRILHLLSRTIVAFVCLLALANPGWGIPTTSVPLFYSIGVPSDGRGELDSVALWVASGNAGGLLFISDKVMDSIEIHNVVTNTYVGRLGSSGTGLGQMQRPNGLVVGHQVPTSIGPRDMLFVAERDNNRVSAWLIPYMYPLGEIGVGDISEPYGVTYHVDQGVAQIWVTSTGYSPQRVQVFDVTWDAQSGLQSTLNRWFPVPESSVLETIVVDPVQERVLVCDEDAFDVMAFSMAGSLLTRFGTWCLIDKCYPSQLQQRT